MECQRFLARFRARIEFRKAVWVLPCVWALHEAEEWNILLWFHTYWVNVPQISQVGIWTWLGFIAFVGFAWTFFAALLNNPKLEAFIVLPFFTVIVFGNALQHVYFVFKFGAYAPGVVTSVLLIIPGVLYVTGLALREKLIPVWYAVLIYLPVVPQLAMGMRSGNEVPPIVHALAKFSLNLANFLFGHGG